MPRMEKKVVVIILACRVSECHPDELEFSEEQKRAVSLESFNHLIIEKEFNLNIS